jgi:hypothetical protein
VSTGKNACPCCVSQPVKWLATGSIRSRCTDCNVQTGSGTQPASYPMSTMGSFHGVPRLRMPGALPPLLVWCSRFAYRTQILSLVTIFSASFLHLILLTQSVQRWATGWMIGVLGFDSRRGLWIFLFTTASRTVLGPTQPPVQWVPGAHPRGKAAGTWSWPLTSI